MVKLFIVILFCLISSYAYAGNWYIMNAEKKVMVKTPNKPNDDDLSMRGEFAIYSDVDIYLEEADYRNKAIVKHVKTDKEIKEQIQLNEQAEEENMIRKQMRKQAIEALKAEGKVFKHIKDVDE